MPSHISTVRRIHVLLRNLNGANRGFQPINIRACSTNEKVAIGEISKNLRKSEHKEYVPRKYCKCVNVFII